MNDDGVADTKTRAGREGEMVGVLRLESIIPWWMLTELTSHSINCRETWYYVCARTRKEQAGTVDPTPLEAHPSDLR